MRGKIFFLGAFTDFSQGCIGTLSCCTAYCTGVGKRAKTVLHNAKGATDLQNPSKPPKCDHPRQNTPAARAAPVDAHRKKSATHTHTHALVVHHTVPYKQGTDTYTHTRHECHGKPPATATGTDRSPIQRQGRTRTSNEGRASKSRKWWMSGMQSSIAVGMTGAEQQHRQGTATQSTSKGVVCV